MATVTMFSHHEAQIAKVQQRQIEEIWQQASKRFRQVCRRLSGTSTGSWRDAFRGSPARVWETNGGKPLFLSLKISLSNPRAKAQPTLENADSPNCTRI